MQDEERSTYKIWIYFVDVSEHDGSSNTRWSLGSSGSAHHRQHATHTQTQATMSEKKGAYNTTASDTNFRRKWDKEEYTEKARQKDADEKERMQENEQRMKQGKCTISHWRMTFTYVCYSSGKKPRKGKKLDAPKPTELMKRRDYELELDKNLNKTVVVANPTGRGPGQPGFHCETCNRTYRDTTAYLDHINGRQREFAPFLFESA